MSLARDPAARRRLAALGAVAGVAALAGLVAGATGGGEEESGEGSAGSRPAPYSGRPDVRSGERLALERQVGQLLLMGFDGTTVPEYIRRRLRRGEGAGVILFAKNAPDAEALSTLTTELQRSASGGALIATDQEGGTIRSIPYVAPQPSQAALSTPAAAGAAARDGARELRRAGINVNLAPVADVASVPGSVVSGRAFPGEPRAVSSLVAASVRAHADGGVAATVKHFPGLGTATANTDDAPVTVTASRTSLEGGDLPPFGAAVDAGVPLVMASHALYPALDERAIASQSRPVLVDLLRERLGFRGAVVTDSIEADAVLARSGVAAAAGRSIEAGADLILLTGSGSWSLVYPALLRRARRDQRFRERVAEAAGRVLALKRRLGLRAPGMRP